MSNSGYMIPARRAEIIRNLMENRDALQTQDDIRKAAQAPFFDIVATLHYGKATGALPIELRYLADKYPCVPWLQDKIDEMIARERQVTSPKPAVPAEPEEVRIEPQSTPPSPGKPAAEVAAPATDRISSMRDYGRICHRIEEFVQYVRANRPKTISHLATHFGVDDSTIRRVLHGLRHAQKNLDVPRRVLWRNASNETIPPQCLEELKLHPITVREVPFDKAVPASKPVAPPPPVAALTENKLAAAVLKAAKAGDGEAAVKLAQMQDLLSKYVD